MDNKEPHEELEILSDDVSMLMRHKKSAYDWQERRHSDWTENYTLYRDKVTLNRLTQRQSVNIPLMKTSIKTALKEVDDAPMLYFKNLDNDKDREIIYNEYAKHCFDYNKLILKDIVDKKQVFLYGRSFKKLNIVNGKFVFEILDPHDVLVDRYCDPTDIDTAHYVCHQHIFKPLSSLEAFEEYDTGAIMRLKSYMATNAGLLKADENLNTLTDRNDRMRQMGVPDVDNPVLGETYIELNEHYVKKWNDENKEEEFYLYVTAEGREVLFEKRLEEVIGITKDNFWRYHLPINSWGDDIERTDVWSDGMADTIRTPNKILNSWISQLVENRTLRNFGMNFYDATIEGFNPQTYEPLPGGWYGLPGKPREVYERIDIPDLSEAIDEMEFILQVAEKASAATSIQQGATEERQITLGEVQLALANATERVKAMSIFYTEAWKDFGIKFDKMHEAAGDKIDDVTLYKKGVFNDEMYARDVKSSDWRSKAGYNVEVMSITQKEEEELVGLQKINAVSQMIPGNVPLMEIMQKKALEFAGLNPEEMQEVIEFERQKAQQPADPLLEQGAMAGQPVAPPVQTL